jgi:hypothetical protein
MTGRRFPPPWTVIENAESLWVQVAGGQTVGSPTLPVPAAEAFFQTRQKSERPGADRRNYSRPRTAIAMIGMKSPGLDGGYGGMCQDRDLLLGKSGPSLLP